MIGARAGCAVAVFCALGAVAPAARADDPLLGKPRFFYDGYDYGSQSLFGPAYVFVNRGYDVFQLRPANRNPFRQAYALDGGNVLDNVAHPFSAIESRGWSRFTREELLPLSWTTASARWAPNYGLHLIGGGVTYPMLSEWFDDRGVPAPGAFSALTMYAGATSP